MIIIITRRAWQSQTWDRPAPEVRVQNQFRLSKFFSQQWHVDWKSFVRILPPVQKLLGRPYVVTGGLLFCSWYFLYFFQCVIFELPRSITAKLSHMIGTCVNFINWLQKIRGALPPNKLGAKNMENFGRFYTTSDFDCEYLRNGSRYPKTES